MTRLICDASVIVVVGTRGVVAVVVVVVLVVDVGALEVELGTGEVETDALAPTVEPRLFEFEFGDDAVDDDANVVTGVGAGFLFECEYFVVGTDGAALEDATVVVIVVKVMVTLLASFSLVIEL